MTNKHLFHFPANFLWGAATSSHQVEGHNIQNDWWQWEQAGRVREPSGAACDQWNRFEDDFKLAKSLNHNAHRFSIEWSRVEPAEGSFDIQALAHYQTMLESLRRNGLEPIVTLNHFTLPQWFAKKGGWLSNDAPQIFARYAKKVFESIGGGVRYWITINEPMVYVYKSYLAGQWPPGEQDFKKLWPVVSALLRAHVEAYGAIHESALASSKKSLRIGIAQNIVKFVPCSPYSPADRLTVWLRDLLYNHLFVKALVKGKIHYPGIFKIRLPRAGTLDFIGINYYTRDFVHNRGFRNDNLFGETCTLTHHENAGKRNALGWEIYPKGFVEILKEFSRYRLPLLVTENGICTDNDRLRLEFIQAHLSALASTIKQGAPVFGYLYWSLLDNFEWSEGFSPHFGLVGVDYKTQERLVRDSARWLAQVCGTSSL